ncbi:hypothetical protein FF011L_13930 [Roseimaritima multifibrata]|uniref:Sulfatase n=1 Tax=Roseimaritima multifibrata TaxID=1930274 RepID=A0A517MCU6_9BACT|nr:DUF1501 domain-containing protein [Roseimaritima multifibrata]QDS92646.1 hypothetical protein FF011L_13930 [Roseimaritima multifibrata]
MNHPGKQNHNLHSASVLQQTRRQFLSGGALGVGGLYMASQGLMLPAPAAQGQEVASVTNPLTARAPHFPPRVKNIISIHLAGSPPTLDMFNYRPELNRLDGQPCPDSFLAGRKFAFTSGTPTLMGSPHKFEQVGQAGHWMSDTVTHLREVADELCFVHSMYTDQFNHAPAQLLLLTGSPRQGRPSMGSWVTYGLGSENQDLPGFVALISGGTQPSAGKNAWGSGFLPSVFQGVQCRSKGDPVLYVSDPPGMTRSLRRKSLDTLNELNQLQMQQSQDPETLTRIAQYELAYRMQASVPEAMDISRETAQTMENYGATVGGSSLANNCLLARRLVEQGVRFVQLFDWGWDFHGTSAGTGLGDGLRTKSASMDRPVAALIKDLRQRGLLDETLILWGGEFGRTPFREGRTAKSKVLGRDHYPDCYSIFMAGGGVRGGHQHGATDELGFGVASDGVHVHDLQATLLHQMGIDHERLTYRFQGRDYRLTDVHGKVVHELLT